MSIGRVLTRFGEYAHRDTILARCARVITSTRWFLATAEIRPSDGGVTITSQTLNDANWTALATGLSGVVKWRISELNGDDFYYAYTNNPGDNFMVGWGWVSYDTDISQIYVKKPSGTSRTLKFERWILT